MYLYVYMYLYMYINERPTFWEGSALQQVIYVPRITYTQMLGRETACKLNMLEFEIVGTKVLLWAFLSVSQLGSQGPIFYFYILFTLNVVC